MLSWKTSSVIFLDMAKLLVHRKPAHRNSKIVATRDDVALQNERDEAARASANSMTPLHFLPACHYYPEVVHAFGPTEPAQGYSPMDEAARREWVYRKCAKYEDLCRSPSEKASERKYFEERLAAVERLFWGGNSRKH